MCYELQLTTPRELLDFISTIISINILETGLSDSEDHLLFSFVYVFFSRAWALSFYFYQENLRNLPVFMF